MKSFILPTASKPQAPLYHFRQWAWGQVGLSPLARWLSHHLWSRALARDFQSYHFALPYTFVNTSMAENLVITIDPSLILSYLVSHTKVEENYYYLREYFLGGGDWSRILRPLDKLVQHKEIDELFLHDKEFRTMPIYQRLLKRIRQKGCIHHNRVVLDSQENLDLYFQRYVSLHQSIRRHGLLSCSEFHQHDNRVIPQNLRDIWVERNKEDIGMAIDRDGQLYRFRGGAHRFSIARNLGLKNIPVGVKFVHGQWLQKLMAETGLPPQGALVFGLRQVEKRYS